MQIGGAPWKPGSWTDVKEFNCLLRPTVRIAAKMLGKLHRAAVGALILNAQMQNIV